MAKRHNPGQDSACDDFYNPHGAPHAQSPHSNMGRSETGAFTGYSGSDAELCADGDAMVAHLGKKTRKSTPSDGDGWL